MNCEEFWEKGPEGLDHLRECAACAALYQRERNLAAGLKALGAQMRRVEAPGRVERRLVSAFRKEMGVAPPVRAPWLPLLTWGTAAAATVMLALFLLHGRDPQPVRHSNRSGIELAALAPPASLDPASSIMGEDGFIPLPNAEQIGPNDQVDLVRVEVPRSAIVALGIPANEVPASEQVAADVALGADGVARAVRFLDE